jgi:hypothetical protein
MYDEPQHGGLVDKQFIYTLIIITIIIGGAFMVINRLDIFGEKFHGGSWYIYCDLEHKTCSCNTYGLLDKPSTQQMKICIDFMKEYYASNNTTYPIIINVDTEIIK